MKNLLLTFCLLIGLGAAAQERELKKLNRLYSKGKFEKCADYAKECIREYRQYSFPYDFAIKSYIASIPEAERISQEYLYLRKALRILERYPDTTNPTFILAYQELYGSAEEMKSAWRTENPRHVERLDKVMDILHDMGAVPIQPEPLDLVDPYGKKAINYRADSVREVLLGEAIKLRGKPYKFGGEDQAGFDCSGFTKYVYQHVGIQLPHNAYQQSVEDGLKKRLEVAEPRDIIFFGGWLGDSYKVQHTGIVFANEAGTVSMIHCSSSKGVIVETGSPAWEKYWLPKVLFVKDFISPQFLPN